MVTRNLPAYPLRTNRRNFLKGAMRATVLGTAAVAGLLRPRVVVAKDWPANAFRAQNVDAVLEALFPGQQLVPSDAIALSAPIAPENGAVVPVKVRTTLADVRSITVVCMKNPFPLAGSFQLHQGLEGELSTRVKLAESQQVKAIVHAGDKYFVAAFEVKITSGGCGG